MSTTEDDTTTTDAPTLDDLPDAVDRDRVERDRELYGEYRSLMRLSPQNEAAACETTQEARAAISREAFRETPREWVLAELNARLDELQEAADAE